MDSVAAGAAFASGNIALMINWFGFATAAHTTESSAVRGHVDVASLPRGTHGSSVSLNVYWLLAIASGSPHPATAWQFLKHVLSPGMDKLTTVSGAIGCRRSTWSDPEVNASVPFYHRIAELHTQAREIPQRADWPAIATIIDDLVTAALSGAQSVESLLQQADARASLTNRLREQMPAYLP